MHWTTSSIYNLNVIHPLKLFANPFLSLSLLPYQMLSNIVQFRASVCSLRKWNHQRRILFASSIRKHLLFSYPFFLLKVCCCEIEMKLNWRRKEELSFIYLKIISPSQKSSHPYHHWFQSPYGKCVPIAE